MTVDRTHLTVVDPRSEQTVAERDAASAETSAQVELGGILKVLPAAVYTTDAAGRITFYNEAAADLWV